MYQEKLNKRGLRSALLLGATSVAALAFAAPALAEQETVVVTGSRIPQQGLYSSSPVTAVGQQELKLQGTTNVESLLNNLPSVFADFGQGDSNGATGTATVNLRNLGAQRTLVLVDGSRLMPGDPFDPVADLNDIPAAMVDHVEVLTGGASAVYGSDAVAGVVNFIMRKDFEGVEVDGTYTIHQEDNGIGKYDALLDAAGRPRAPTNVWDGRTGDATLILGINSDNGKGNVTGYLSYRNVQPILQSARDFSACALADFGGGPVCFGSSNFNRWISIDNASGGLSRSQYDLFELGTGAPGSGTMVPYTSIPSSQRTYNFGPKNYIQRPDERYTGGFYAHYDISKQAEVYANFMFADDHTVAQIAPSGLFLGTGKAYGAFVEVNCDNPLMTAQERHQLCGLLPGDVADNGAGNLVSGQALLEIGRRDIEGGNRQADLRHTSYRMQLGLKGDLGDGWAYDIYGQYGTTVYNQVYSNEFSVQRVQNALQVNSGTGNCQVYDLNIDTTCVPLDIFNGIGSISSDALNYVAAQGFMSGNTTEQILSGSVTGDLGMWGGQSPWAKTPIGVALGGEYRSESLQLQTSRDFQTNDLYGQGSPTLPIPKSGFNVVEGFGELRIPVVQDEPFVKDFTVTAGYRYSSYNLAGAVSAYKYGAEWQITDDVKVRGSYNRAVRAPNVLELFSPIQVGLITAQDPCATSTSGQCASVPHAGSGLLNCPASQCNAQFGGNQNLSPEISDTRTIGLVLTPTFFDGFTATVDYFDIHVSGAIGTIPGAQTLAGCYGPSATPASVAFFCPLVNRNASGQIFGGGYVSQQNTNTGWLTTKGWDLEANYVVDLSDWGWDGAGSLSANFIGTILSSYKVLTVPGSSPVACEGLYGSDFCGTPLPKWRHKARLTWSTPWDVDVSLAWRMFSGVKADIPGLLSVENIPAISYFDLAGSWTIRDGVELRAGVNNMFDKSPHAVDSTNFGLSGPPFGNGNTFPNVYDTLGRTIFVGGTIKY